MTDSSAPAPSLVPAQPVNAAAVVGVAAFSRTVACTRYAKDADKAPDMAARVALMRMSAGSVASFDRVCVLAAEHGLDATSAAGRYVGFLGDFDERTRPTDWAERVLKTHLGLGLLGDFAAGLADTLQEPLRATLRAELADDCLTEFASSRILPIVSADPQVGARLSLWGRRVVGEEIGTLQRMLAAYPDILGESTGAEVLHDVLSQGAVGRMKALGLRA